MPSVTADQRQAVEPPPGGIALEGHGIPGIEPQPQPVDHDLGHRRHVAQREVPALAGDRVDAARGIADQHGAMRRVAVGQDQSTSG